MYMQDHTEPMLSKDTVSWSPSRPSLSTGSLESSSLKFPTMKSDDMAITRAISAIFFSDSSASSSMSDLSQLQSLVTCQSGFEHYNSTIPPTFEPRSRSSGQKMIKDSISYLRKINLMKDRDVYQEEGPSGHHLLHLTSERKRREKLNGSFYELRLLLPPSSKKDKASVLCKTKDYLKTLEAQIFELEQKNQMLEVQHSPTDKPKQDISRSICRKNVQIIGNFEPVIGIRRINLKITAGRECDLLELVLHALEHLKEIGAICLVSMDANTYLRHMLQFSCVTINFDIKASDWDAISFIKGMRRAVDIATVSS